MAEHIEARKDVFYGLKNNPGICWKVSLWMFGMKFIKLAASQGIIVARHQDRKCINMFWRGICQGGQLDKETNGSTDWHVQNP